MLRVLCSPTPAAFRDSRAVNWRMLHADAPLGQNNDRSNQDSPDELGSGANCSDFLDCLEVLTRGRLPAQQAPAWRSRGINGNQREECVRMPRKMARQELHLEPYDCLSPALMD